MEFAGSDKQKLHTIQNRVIISSKSEPRTKYRGITSLVNGTDSKILMHRHTPGNVYLQELIYKS